AVPLLRTAARDAEAGDHLVEDEQRARGVAERAQRLEKAVDRRDDAHVPGDRLDDDRREPLAVAHDRLGCRVDVVVGADDRVARDGARHARRRRDSEGREARAGAREQRVGMAVVAAGELEDPVALREAAREAERAHRRLRPRRDEPHLLDRRHRVRDLGRELHLRLGGRAEARAAERRLAHRLDRLRVGVPEDERAPRADPVEVAVPVDVDEVRAFPALDEERLVQADGAHRPHRRVDAAGDQLERTPVQLRASAQSHCARSFVQYETIRSAPARLIAVSDSSAAWRSSSQPARAAAFTIAYSPETLYAATGTSNASRTARMTSR